MATYRVFVTRHYIDVCFFDVESETPRKAKTLAKKAAYKLREDSRAVACDNGWHADAPVTIGSLGDSSVPFTPELFLQTKQGKAYIDTRVEKMFFGMPRRPLNGICGMLTEHRAK